MLRRILAFALALLLLSSGLPGASADRTLSELQQIYAARHTITSGGGDGSQFAAAILADGTVQAFWHELDVSGWKDVVTLDANGQRLIGLCADGTVLIADCGYEWSEMPEFDVSSWADITAISCSNTNLVGLKRDGTVVVTGSNQFGQCQADHLANVVSVLAGENFIAVVLADGTVQVVGIDIGSTLPYSTVDEATGEYVILPVRNADVADWENIAALATTGLRLYGLRTDGTLVDTFCHNLTEYEDFLPDLMQSYGFDTDASDWTDIVAIDGFYGSLVGMCADGTVRFTGWSEAVWGPEAEGPAEDIAAGGFYCFYLSKDRKMLTPGGGSESIVPLPKLRSPLDEGK